MYQNRQSTASLVYSLISTNRGPTPSFGRRHQNATTSLRKSTATAFSLYDAFSLIDSYMIEGGTTGSSTPRLRGITGGSVSTFTNSAPILPDITAEKYRNLLRSAGQGSDSEDESDSEDDDRVEDDMKSIVKTIEESVEGTSRRRTNEDIRNTIISKVFSEAELIKLNNMMSEVIVENPDEKEYSSEDSESDFEGVAEEEEEEEEEEEDHNVEEQEESDYEDNTAHTISSDENSLDEEMIFEHYSTLQDDKRKLRESSWDENGISTNLSTPETSASISPEYHSKSRFVKSSGSFNSILSNSSEKSGRSEEFIFAARASQSSGSSISTSQRASPIKLHLQQKLPEFSPPQPQFVPFQPQPQHHYQKSPLASNKPLPKVSTILKRIRKVRNKITFTNQEVSLLKDSWTQIFATNSNTFGPQLQAGPHFKSKNRAAYSFVKQFYNTLFRQSQTIKGFYNRQLIDKEIVMLGNILQEGTKLVDNFTVLQYYLHKNHYINHEHHLSSADSVSKTIFGSDTIRIENHEQYFTIFGKTLLRTLNENFPAEFDTKLERVWGKFYQYIFSCIVGGIRYQEMLKFNKLTIQDLSKVQDLIVSLRTFSKAPTDLILVGDAASDFDDAQLFAMSFTSKHTRFSAMEVPKKTMILDSPFEMSTTNLASMDKQFASTTLTPRKTRRKFPLMKALQTQLGLPLASTQSNQLTTPPSSRSTSNNSIVDLDIHLKSSPQLNNNNDGLPKKSLSKDEKKILKKLRILKNTLMRTNFFTKKSSAPSTPSHQKQHSSSSINTMVSPYPISTPPSASSSISLTPVSSYEPIAFGTEQIRSYLATNAGVGPYHISTVMQNSSTPPSSGSGSYSNNSSPNFNGSIRNKAVPRITTDMGFQFDMPSSASPVGTSRRQLSGNSVNGYINNDAPGGVSSSGPPRRLIPRTGNEVRRNQKRLFF